MKVILDVIKLCSGFTRSRFWLSLVAALGTAVISVYANIIFGLLAERIVSMQQDQWSTVQPVIYTLAAILALFLGNAFLSYFQERFSNKFRFTALYELRIKGYEKLQRLPIEFYQNHRTGTIVQRTTYVNTVINWVADFTSYRIYNVVLPVLSLIPLFNYSPLIGCVTLMGIILTVSLQMRKTRVRKPHLVAGNDAWDEAVGVFNEHVSQVMTTRTSTDQPALNSIFRRALDTQLSHRRIQNRIEQNYNTAQLVCESLIISAVISIAVYLAYKGSIGLAALIATTTLIRNIMMNSRGISVIYDSLITASTEGRKYLDLMNEEDSKIETSSGQKLYKIQTIKLENVGFKYSDSEKESLRDISFEVSADRKIGIVGVSGGGKSTLAKLLMRLHKPTSGRILINNRPIDNFSTSSYRHCLGVVMQDVALYHISIADNIRLAKPDASDGEIDEALMTANAREFVSALPNGMYTVVGERGVKLSGGQRQRIAIARAAIKKPSCIILDEATSALDSSAEKQVQKGLAQIMKSTSSIIIAHRLSTIKDCDEILVLDDGRITERGSHDQLIKVNGRYAKLWHDQTSDKKRS